MAAETADAQPSSSTAEKTESTKEVQDAFNLLAQGKRNMLCGEVPKAVQQLEEACRLLAEKYGEVADQCGDAYLAYGSALLDLSRMESGVLGNALKGIESESEEESAASDDKVEDPEKVSEKEKEEIGDKVIDAMLETDEEQKARAEKEKGDGEKSDQKKDEKTEEKKDVKTDDEKVKKDEVEKKDEKKDETKDVKKDETKDEKKDETKDEKKDETKDEKKDETKDEKKDDTKDEKESKEEKKDDEKMDVDAEKAKDETVEKEETKKKEKDGEKKEKDEAMDTEEKKDEEGEAEGEESEALETEEEEAAEGEECDQGEEGAEGADEEKKSDTSQEEVSTLQLAWETLELAKVIYLRHEEKDMKLKASEAHLKLGEVGLETEQYETAIEDFKACLKLQQTYLDPESRLIAETHYQIGLACTLACRYTEALDNYRLAVKTIECKIAKLKSQIEESEKSGKHKEAGSFDENVIIAEKEIKDLSEILPDIRAKMEDTEDEMKSQDKVKELVKESVATDASTTVGFGGESSKASPKKAASGPATDISHMIRKKRKPEDEPEDDDAAKKAKKEDDSKTEDKKAGGDGPATNGTNGTNGTTEHANGTNGTNGTTSPDKKEEIKTKTVEDVKKAAEEATA